MRHAMLPVRARQTGVALAVALIMLVVLTLLALSGIRLSTMELRIALNDELRIQAFEEAQSLIDATIRDFSNTPIVAPDITLCARTDTGCDQTTIDLPDRYDDELEEKAVQVRIERIQPLSAEPPVGTGFSLTAFDAAYLSVNGAFDRTELGRGAAQVNEGIAVVFGSAGDITVANQQNEL